MFYENTPIVQGAGGGGKKSGGGRVTANNLQSLARARFVELISEGEIHGLVNGAKSIFFNQTPLQNEDNTFNFDNVMWEERKGLPDDAHLNGHQAVEQVTSVETEVKVSSGAVVRTIVQPNADAVRVIIRLNALFTTDDKGNINTHTVSYRIEMRPSGGVFTQVVNQTISNRKTSSPVQIAHRIELPSGHTSWEIRVTRLSPDDTLEKNQSGITWESYVTLVEGRFTYPNSALVSMEVNAEDLGTSIPPRAFEIKGLKINVPVNYNPDTRVYTGIWNGAFKTAWTNNPAWIFYDLIVNDRYGLGEFINASEIDKWGLYQIGQYCDGMVPSGFKDNLNADILEPRFTFNGIISTREEAYFTLQKITTAFRGMGYWAIGQYFATADMPEDPVLVVAPANVIGGEFTYSSTAMKARHNVALIKWNDPQDFYRPATELVIDEASLQKNGWREKRLDFLGCTSRGLARRYGKWVLDTENSETETVEYQAGFDHANLRPGHIIAITDPRKATVRMGGRIVSHVGNTVTLDQDFTLTGGVTYQIYLSLPDGQLVLANVTGRPAAGQLTISTTAQQAMAGSVFVISASNLKPKTYRVLTVKEVSENVFSVSALEHDPNKYTRVEQNLVLDDIPYSVERVSTPPTGLTALQNTYIEDGSIKTRLTVSWTPPVGSVVRAYVVSVESPLSNLSPYATTQQNSIEIPGLSGGSHTVRVVTIDRLGQSSAAASITVTIGGAASLNTFSVTGLQNLDNPGSTIFRGDSPSITWVNSFQVAPDVAATVTTSPLYESNIVRVYDSDTSTLLRTETVVGTAYTYGIEFNRQDSLAKGFTGARRNLRFEVQIKNVNGLLSANAVLTMTNPTPPAITPSISIELASAFISWNSVADEDYRGVRAWIGSTAGFDPLVAVPVFDGSGGSFTYKGAAGTTVYLKLGAYDAFSKSDMIISGPFTVNLSSIAAYSTEINATVDGAVQEALSTLSVYDADFDVIYSANEVFSDLTGLQDALTQAAVESEALTRADSIQAIAARLDTVEAVAGGVQALTQIQQVAIANINGRAESMLAFRTKAGTAQAELELIAQSNPDGTTSIARISAKDIILQGTVTADLIQAKAITADLLDVDFLVAGRVSAEYLDVNTLLTIGEYAGLRYGKANAASDEIDGIYIGRDANAFGFAVSRTNNNKRQSLKITSDTGLQLLNARHFVSGQTPLVAFTQTTNLAKTFLPAGTTGVKFTMVGGGAAGGCLSISGGGSNWTTTGRYGEAGLPSVVRLYDGSTLIATYSGDGAPQTPGTIVASPSFGQVSFVTGAANGPGAGGNGASGSYVRQPIGQNGEPRTVFVYALGGAAAPIVTTVDIDVSSLTAPAIEIDIGLGGVNTGWSGAVGAPGTAGQVIYSYRTAADIPADVVPLVPSFVGSFVKAAGATGAAVFPDLGPGLWVLHGFDAPLNLGNIQVATGSTTWINAESSGIFFASQRPNILSAGTATARTIHYLFYSMSQWG